MPIWLFIVWAIVFFTVFFIGLSWLANMAMAWAGRKYSEKTRNEYLEKMQKMLPGKDCGECDCQTCHEYAGAVFYGRTEADKCPYGKENLPEELQKLVNEFVAFLDSGESIEDIKKAEKERRFNR